MNTFIKTFFICLIATFSFLAYQYFSPSSYETDLSVSKQNPVFGLHKETIKEAEEIDLKKPVQKSEIKEDITTKQYEDIDKDTKKTYTHVCYFYSVNGDLVPVYRELSKKPTIENTIVFLLKGPTIPEAKRGIYSEIPANVDLISVKKDSKSIIINLTSNFGNGGGTQSVSNRVKQIARTVKTFSPNASVYLHIDGKEVEYLGGDGVYIKQPIE